MKTWRRHFTAQFNQVQCQPDLRKYLFSPPGLLVLVALLSFGALRSEPQSSNPQESEFKVEVRLVQIEVRVTRESIPVTGLRKDDFVLVENGALQEIARLDYVPEAAGLAADRPAASSSSPGSRSTLEGEGLQTDPAETEPRTWVYLAPEVDKPQEFQRTAVAIEKFLREEMHPGFLVSLGGLPFTGNRDLLLETLKRMMPGPYGSGSLPPGISAEIRHWNDVEFMRQVALALEDQTVGLTSIARTTREENFSGSLTDIPVMSVEAIDRQVAFYGHLALFRYLDLVERLSVLPGKKVVVLFRSGLRLDSDNYGDMQRLAAAAQRNRVNFYTIDSRGLDAPLPVIDRRFALPFESGRRSPVPDLLGQYARFAESMDGLVVLARRTNGRAILNSNDMGEVLQAVLEDSSGYYVLSYYPKDTKQNGVFRKVQVKVNQRGVEVRAPNGYFEHEPFESQSGKDKQNFLRQALLSGWNGELPVEANLEVFADEDGRPSLFFSIGAPLSHLAAGQSRRRSEVEASILAQLTDALGQKLPIYHEHRLQHHLDRQTWEKASKDAAVFVTYNARIPVSPGRYVWKAVMRDEKSGKMGSNQKPIWIPDFQRTSTPSSLLVSRQTEKKETHTAGKGQLEAGSSLLEASGVLYVPQPSDYFRRGDPIYLLYDLYNPTEEDTRKASEGMELAVFCKDQPVKNIEAAGQPIISSDGRSIRFVAVIGTANLEPCTYRIFGMLPNRKNRAIPHLEGRVRLLADE